METSNFVTLINGQIQNTISVSDRGLAYGDGLFETILVHNSQPVFYSQHLGRLIAGCQRLGLSSDKLESELDSDLKELLCQNKAEFSVLKILITRGVGKRGYFPDPETVPTRVVSMSPYTPAAEKESKGIRVRWCETPVSSNPALAGMKHLNRLENVLARAEWSDPDISEGLMMDVDGQVIEGTMSNLFFIKDGVLCTPDLSRSGVNGIIRQQLIDIAKRENLTVQIGFFNPKDVSHADEIFVCNSLINIWPVLILGDHQFPLGSVTQELQKLLKKEMFA